MRINELFCDGAVFQAYKPIRFFGTGGGNLKISFCGNNYESDKVGTEWEVEFPAMQYGGPFELSITLDGKEQVFHDIYIGDVYILAGQSNIQLKLKEANYSPNLYCTDPLLRLFSTERMNGGEKFFPQDGWVKVDAENAGDWPCLGYLTGIHLREKTNHAISFITCYQGAAAIQSYLPDFVFENPIFNIPDEERFDNVYPWNKGHSLLYHYQLEKITPFSSSGVIWYQGESNVSQKESAVYGEMLSSLIHSWRKAFKDELLPFVIIQIADFIGRDTAPWHIIQQAQEEIQHKELYVKTVISRDVCENTDIHPKNKYELAKRIADAIHEKL